MARALPATDSHPLLGAAPAATARRRTALLSLRWRLTLSFGLAFMALLAVLFFTLHQLLVNTLLHDVDDELATHAAHVASAAADPAVFGDPARLRELVHSSTVGGLVTTPTLTAIRSLHGAVLAQSSDVRLDEVAPTRAQLNQLRERRTTFRTFDTDGGRQFRVITEPLVIDDTVVGSVQAGESLEGLFSAGERLQALLIIEGAVGLLLASAFGYLVVSRNVRPLTDMGAVAADIEAHDLTRRLNMSGRPVEAQRLADTFDSMLDRIEQAFAQQRSFVLDVSHELRSPLTALRGNLDVLLMDPALPPTVRPQVERMSAETSRLIRLAANLLFIARAEMGRPAVVGPVELDLLCLDVVQEARNLRPDVRLRLGEEDQITVQGDRDLLKQLLLNLVENGMVYTPAGGQVTLSLRADEAAGAAVIEVRDSGIGIAAADLPRIFERFYRGEAARRHASGGAGVGLAIVEWVARLHHGAVTVASEPGQGSVFTVRLPLAAPAAGVPTAPAVAAG